MTEPTWIEEQEVLLLHEQLLSLDGGSPRVRSEARLQSALARPKQLHAYGDAPGIVEIAAVYTAEIVRHHPFVDGNKRTGFLVGMLFLELNGYRFVATEEDATQAILQLAAGKLQQTAFTDWLCANAKPSNQ